MRRRLGALICALGLLATGCGGGGEGAESDSSSNETSEASSQSASPTPTEQPTPEGETSDCLVAAQKWADRATDHVLTGQTTGAAFGETVPIEDLDDPQSEITVLCSDELDKAVKRAMVPIATMNYELSLCAFTAGCDRDGRRAVERQTTKAAGLIGDVRALIEQ